MDGGVDPTPPPGGGTGPPYTKRSQTSPPRQMGGSSSTESIPAFYVGEFAEFLDDKESMEKKVMVGICAMAKKSNSKPMKEILKRLENFTRLQVVIFEEDVILNSPVDEWPVVNAFISFFSSGFPLDKAIAYKNLRKPFVVNDLEMQLILQDRTGVYRILEKHSIPHPRYAVLDRSKDPECGFLETEDSIEINGQVHLKPFVEKPINAEDHNVYIYFPQAAGGGSTRLFRKVKDRSSMYSHISRVRRNGSYLYEDFMPTDGTDVKVYTVGTDYQHAEARKSPCLDGKVERDQDGKEVRYPVLLSASEKKIARKVCVAFGQTVCGFDLLRANGKCYVCDVNGFSFVKTSSKYYDDCARILGTMVLRAVCPTLHIPYPVGPAPEDIPVVPTTSGLMMELRCVAALIRHGDRTPKQKMKMEVKNKLFFELFEKYGGFRTGHLKLKRPKQLQEVLDIVRQLLAANATASDPDLQDKKTKLQQMKLVLEMYGHFSGINRKVQLKYQPQGRPKRSSEEEDDTPRDPSLLLILKWGGELTPAGRIQAENLGKAFRTLYPGGQGQFEAPGLGFLRLHSTFRHDLKIYASDEGRVQMTAAAFTKGLLALEGELTPILVQMVKSANTNGLLDGEGKTSKSQLVVKEKLKEVFNHDHDFNEEDFLMLNPTSTIALTNAMEFVKNPQAMCKHVYQMIKEITAKIRALKAELKSRDLPLYNGESWELLIRRWAKLEKDFQLKNGHFECSKIPDIYDCIKYDLQHNQKTLQYERANELFMCSKALADIIIPQEYGISIEEKLHIAQNYCSPFLRKIRSDFLQVCNSPDDDATEDDTPTTRLDSRYSKGVSSPERFVRTRLYFTSESHIHSMLNMLRYGNLFEEGMDSQWERALGFLDATAELNYMSQIVFMLFEDPSKPLDSDDRYHMELHFSPGAYTSCDEPTEPRGMGYRPKHSTSIPGNECDTLKGSTRLVSAFSGPPPQVKKRSLRLEPGIGSDLGDICESDMFEIGQPGSLSRDSPESQDHSSSSPRSDVSTPKALSRLPGSPDPNIPEWDWGDESFSTKANTDIGVTVDSGKVDCQAKDKLLHVSVSVESQKSKGSESNSSVGSEASKPRCSSPININVSSTTNSELSKVSLEEKRSRSLEDKNEKVPDTTTVHRNYKTVHLPLHTDVHLRRSLPCVFSLGLTLSGLRALEGFSYVPQLHPLETLHNTLTHHQIDDFLGRVTTTRYPMPAISPSFAAARPTLMLASPSKYSQSYPPSSNSSSGPSSPSSVPTVDFLSKFRAYIERQEKEYGQSDADPDPGGSSRRTLVAGTAACPPTPPPSPGPSHLSQKCDRRLDAFSPLSNSSIERALSADSPSSASAFSREAEGGEGETRGAATNRNNSSSSSRSSSSADCEDRGAQQRGGEAGQRAASTAAGQGEEEEEREGDRSSKPQTLPKTRSENRFTVSRIDGDSV